MAANSRLLQDIFDHSNLSMKVKDLRGHIVRANAMAGRLLGRPPEELLGQTIDSVATEETAALVRSHDREVIETGRVTTYEEQVAYLGGTYTLLTTRFPVTDERGRVLRPDGTHLEGLYAASNSAASVFGTVYPGPGAPLGSAMVFASLAVRDLVGTRV